MASDSNSSTVAIFAIVLMVLIGAFLAYRSGLFGGDDDRDNKVIDVDVNR